MEGRERHGKGWFKERNRHKAEASKFYVPHWNTKLNSHPGGALNGSPKDHIGESVASRAESMKSML